MNRTTPQSFLRLYDSPLSELVSLDTEISFCTSNIKDLGGNIIVNEDDVDEP